MDNLADSVPILMPLGDRGLLVRFADRLDLDANAAAIAFAQRAGRAHLPGVSEIVPNLVSVLLLYDPEEISFAALAGEVRMLTGKIENSAPQGATHRISVRYGGEDGPDLDAVTQALDLDRDEFIAAHRAKNLKILAVGFAPGFIYCGMHDEALILPRRQSVRASVPAGSILFAAGQTAIAATPLPTGWSVIGRTDFINFDPARNPPTRARAGDAVAFEATP